MRDQDQLVNFEMFPVAKQSSPDLRSIIQIQVTVGRSPTKEIDPDY